MNLKPIYNRLVIRRDASYQSASGLVVIEHSKDRQALKPEGTVLATGHDVQDVQPGDRVVFRTMSGTEVKVDGEDLLVMTEDDVVAVIT
jgi:chaperonin GroES